MKEPNQKIRKTPRLSQAELEPGLKIRSLRKKLSLSQAKLARLLDLTPTAVAAWEQGLNEPSESNYLRLARLCDGELSEFFSGRAGVLPGEAIYFSKLGTSGLKYMTKAMNLAASQPNLLVVADPRWRETLEGQPHHVLWVPVMASRGAGRYPVDMNDPDIEAFLACPLRYAPHGPGHYTAIRIRGDSMKPLLQEEDIVCIEHVEAPISRLRNKLVAALVDGTVLVKYMDHRSSGREIILRSENKNYGPLRFRRSASSRIIGRVTWRWGLLQ